ncbi:MAG: GNAT family N-acetyltransferase [Nitrososphaeria archaeon]
MASEEYIIRDLKALEILALHKMYDSLSDETKFFFHPGFLGLKFINFWWLFAQLGLIASTIKVLRQLLLHTFPFLVFISMNMVNQENKIVGFAFLKIKNRLPNKALKAELGLVIANSFQGKGLGSKLMSELLNVARKVGIKEIFLLVLSNNLRAIRLYEKYGFKHVCETIDSWRGTKSKATIMKLNL